MSRNGRRLEASFEALHSYAVRLSYTVPLHVRDELISELLVAMTDAACKWRPGGAPFCAHVAQRMHWASVDWSRREPGWTRQQGRTATHVELDEELEGHSPSPHRRAEVIAVLELVAGLPARERVALCTPVGRDAAHTLGVTESRVSQLRRDALGRLRDQGALDLIAA